MLLKYELRFKYMLNDVHKISVAKVNIWIYGSLFVLVLIHIRIKSREITRSQFNYI